jgi:diphthamide biosynthesis protein 3
MPLYEEIEIEDMTYDLETLTYSYPCPCGDKFKISLEDLWDGEDIADCQSCTLFISVIYEEKDLPPLPDESDEEDEKEAQEAEGEKEVVEAIAALTVS